jgi:cation transport regulator ChaB
MNVFAANLKFNALNDQTIAKVIFNYFLAQYTDVVKRNCHASATLSAMKAANKAYEEDYRRNDMGVGGFMTGQPYTSHKIQYAEEDLKKVIEEMKEAEAVIQFLRDRFLAGVLA